jgi:hypothetical protein
MTRRAEADALEGGAVGVKGKERKVDFNPTPIHLARSSFVLATHRH